MLWRRSISPRGEVYKRYRIGPRTEPWGTPHKRESLSDSYTSIWTNWERSVKYDVNQSSALPLIPKLGPVYMEKSCPGKRVTLLAESTLPSVYMRKKLTPFPEPGAENRARACSECLALTKLTRIGEPKCLYGEKLARLGGWPYHRKRVTRLSGSPF